MFYCSDCQQDNRWPEGIMKSYAQCELCGAIDFCNDRPAHHLPDTTMLGPKNKELWE